MAKTMVITVDDKTGETEVDLKGFHGKGCDAVIKAMTEGEKVVDTRTKAEYNEKELTYATTRN